MVQLMKIIEALLLIWGLAYFWAAFVCKCNQRRQRKQCQKKEYARLKYLDSLYGRDLDDKVDHQSCPKNKKHNQSQR